MTWHDTTTHRYVEQIFRQSNWIGNAKLTFAFYSPSHFQLLLLDLSIYLKNCMFTIGNWSRIRISSLRALWQWISYSNRDSSYNFRRKGIFLFFFFTDLLKIFFSISLHWWWLWWWWCCCGLTSYQRRIFLDGLGLWEFVCCRLALCTCYWKTIFPFRSNPIDE